MQGNIDADEDLKYIFYSYFEIKQGLALSHDECTKPCFG